MVRQNPLAELLGRARPVHDIHAEGQVRVREGGPQSSRAVDAQRRVRHQREVENRKFRARSRPPVIRRRELPRRAHAHAEYAGP